MIKRFALLVFTGIFILSASAQIITPASLKVSADNKIIVAIANTIYQFNPNGSPDNQFGDNGKAEIDFEARTLEVQPDGKILVAGSQRIEGEGFFFLRRINTDGSPDTKFGTGDPIYSHSMNGKQLTGRTSPNGKTSFKFGNGEYSGGQASLYSLRLQPDGKILAGGTGSFYDGGNSSEGLAVARFNDDGTVDEQFGNSGVATWVKSGLVADMKVRADGKIVLSVQDANMSSYLVQLNKDGSIDKTFARSGMVNVADHYMDLGMTTGLGPLFLQADDKILVGDHLLLRDVDPTKSRNSGMRVHRFLPDGKLDFSFGNKGEVRYLGLVDQNHPTYVGEVSQLLVQPDNKILVLAGGQAINSSGPSVAIFFLRLNSNGEFDKTFAPAGVKFVDLGIPYAIELLKDGKFLMVVSIPEKGFALARLTKTADVDKSFGDSGIVLIK